MAFACESFLSWGVVGGFAKQNHDSKRHESHKTFVKKNFSRYTT